jgi:hypothetical protein
MRAIAPRIIVRLRHPISWLAPDTELCYWIVGPQQYPQLASQEVVLDLRYSDHNDHQFNMRQVFNFSYLGVPGSEERGLDLGRENNDPLVRAVRDIADSVTSRSRASFPNR